MQVRPVLLTSATLAALASLALGLSVPRTMAFADDPKVPPVQFVIKVQYVALNEVAGKKAVLPEADELRRTGIVVGDATDRLRTATAAQIAVGTASVESHMTLAVLDGIGGELRQGLAKDGPGWAGAFVPRLVGEKVSLDLKLRYGSLQGKVFTGQSFDEKLVLPENGRLAVRFAPSKESPRERIVLIEITRGTP